MYINETVALKAGALRLIPYHAHHVPKYHEWMKDEEIQVLTASEPLSLEEEYAMQKSWRQDRDKLTFIICADQESEQQNARNDKVDGQNESNGASGFVYRKNEVDDMVGDINLFLNLVSPEVEDEHSDSKSVLVGEVELMIAERGARGKGFGKLALLVFIKYLVKHQREIVCEYTKNEPGLIINELSYLRVKIGKDNNKSLALFRSIGFKAVLEVPNYFDEFELRLEGSALSHVTAVVQQRGSFDYQEVAYLDPISCGLNSGLNSSVV